MKKIVCISILLAIFSFSFAQNQKGKFKDSTKKAIRIKIENLKKELLAKKLLLTEENRAKFFAIYDPYSKSTKEIKKLFNQKWKGKDKNNLSEEEAKLYLKDVLTMRKKEIELFEKLSLDLTGIIPTSKIIQIPQYEKQINKLVFLKIKEEKQKKNP